MTRTRHAFALVLVLLLLAGASCNQGTAVKTLEVSGESLNAVGRNFVAINAMFVQGCDASKIYEKDKCNKWVTFGEGFKKSYRPAMNAWEIAVKTNDEATKQSAAMTIVKLSADLAKLAAGVIDLTQGGK